MIICYVTFNFTAPYRLLMYGPSEMMIALRQFDWFQLAWLCYWREAR